MRVLCLVALLVTACKGRSSPPPAALIDIRPITITFRGQPIAKLFADGHTEAVGENPPGGAMSPGPTLQANGTIKLTKGGTTARISSSGEIYVRRPNAKEELFGRIADDHLAIGTDNGVHVLGDTMTFDNEKDDVGKIEGPVDDGMRRTALVMFAAFLIDKP